MPRILRLSGYANRREYWIIQVVAILIGIAVGISTNPMTGAMPVIAVATLLATSYAQIAAGVRRCRAASISPGWVITFFIPFVAAIPLAIVGILPNRRQQ